MLKKAQKLYRKNEKELVKNNAAFAMTEREIAALNNAVGQFTNRFKDLQLRLTAISSDINEPIKQFVAVHSSTQPGQSLSSGDIMAQVEELEGVHDAANVLVGSSNLYNTPRPKTNDDNLPYLPQNNV